MHQVLRHYFSGSKGCYDMLRLSEQPTAVLEKERLEREAVEREKAEKERLEKERIEKSRKEREREHKQHLEEEKHEKEHHDRLEREQLRKERTAAKIVASPVVGPQINLPIVSNNSSSSSSSPTQPSASEIVHAVELTKPSSTGTSSVHQEPTNPGAASTSKTEPNMVHKRLLGSPWLSPSATVVNSSSSVLKKAVGPPRITNPEVFTADEISAALLVQVLSSFLQIWSYS
jgi:hypothetical protein